MKDRRKKVFLMSVLVFLLGSSTVYIFLIINAVNDLKTKSLWISEYTGAKRALLPVMKYLKIIEPENIANAFSLKSKEDAKHIDEVMGINNEEGNRDGDIKNDVSSNSSGNYYGSGKTYVSGGKTYYPSSKLSGGLTSSIEGGGGGTSTSYNPTSKLSGLMASSSPKGIGVEKKSSANPSYNIDKKGSVISRLNTTKSLLSSALTSKSADSGRLQWDKSFTGSIKADHKTMYGDETLVLDKMNANVADLKLTDETKGLKAPEVGKPELEKNYLSKNETNDLLKSMIQSMASSMINPLSGGMKGGGGVEDLSSKGGDGGEENSIDPTKPIDENQLPPEIRKIIQESKWPGANENVKAMFFPCGEVNCSALSKESGVDVSKGIYKAYFPDGYVVSISADGKFLTSYYFIETPQEYAKMMENYQKYVLGK